MLEHLRRAVGTRLREARLTAKMTQEDVATDFLRSRQAVSAWEVGKAMPTLMEFRGLLALYGASAEKILFGDEVSAECELILLKAKQPQSDFVPSAIGEN